MASKAVVEFVVRQAAVTFRPEYEVELRDVEGDVAYVQCRRASEVACAECEVSGPDLRAFLLDMLAKRGVGVSDVVVSVS